MTAAGVGVLWLYRDALRPAGATVIALSRGSTAPAIATAAAAPLVLAVARPTSREVSALVAPLARARGGAVHVLHVVETDVLAGEESVDLESSEQGLTLLAACMDELREACVEVTGELLHSYGTHADVAAAILRRASDLGAGAIVLGPETRRATADSVNAFIAAHAPSHVLVVNPDAGALGRPIAAAARD